jgi:CRISPR/Cas system-associated exonuclease Cas4 (RecB family)
MASDSKYTPPEVASIMGLIDTHIRWREEKGKGHRRYFKYHPSEWGKCLRKQQYMHFVQLGYVPPHEKAQGSQQSRLFDKGHNMHARWQNWYFAEMGIMRGLWKCKNPMCFSIDKNGNNVFNEFSPEQKEKMWKVGGRVHGKDNIIGCFRPEKCVCGCDAFEYQELIVTSEEMNFEGHCDVVLDFSAFDTDKYKGIRKAYNEHLFPKKPIVIDMKTINGMQWDRKLMKEGVHKEYIVQITIYSHILDCEYGIVIYENKNDSSAAAYKVERNESAFAEIKRQAKMMRVLSERKLLPPPRPATQDDKECGYCEFAKTCHEGAIWDDKELNEKRKIFYGNLL